MNCFSKLTFYTICDMKFDPSNFHCFYENYNMRSICMKISCGATKTTSSAQLSDYDFCRISHVTTFYSDVSFILILRSEETGTLGYE
jgi:hypothetical protein